MQINEIFDLLNEHKHVTILTPNSYEKKLLYDRILLNTSENIQQIDNRTIKINDSYITFIIPDDFNSIPFTPLILIEFPEQYEHRVLKKVMSDTVMLVQEIA